MFTLVIGGSASGKSEYAERHVMSLGGRRIYIATMEPWDDECRRRIARHQLARAERGFSTIECYTALQKVEVPRDSNVLLEDMGNLAANELYSEQGGGAETVLDGVTALLRRCVHLTIVTNEVFSGGKDYVGDTLRYLQVLAEINRALAKEADRVVELVCGLPNLLKGGTV